MEPCSCAILGMSKLAFHDSGCGAPACNPGWLITRDEWANHATPQSHLIILASQLADDGANCNVQLMLEGMQCQPDNTVQAWQEKALHQLNMT